MDVVDPRREHRSPYIPPLLRDEENGSHAPPPQWPPPPPPPTPRSMAEPLNGLDDRSALLPAILKTRGLAKELIHSFNYFITEGVHKIVEANNLVVNEEDPSVYLSYTGVRVGKPSMLNDSNFETLTPQVCRLNDRTYSAPVMVDIEYTVDQGNKKYVRRWRGDVVIGYIPIMLKSCACILNGKDEAELTYYGECPLDPGGYFIVKGNEKVIVTQEELSNNHIHIETDSKGRVTASVASSTYKKKSKTLFVMENEKIYLQLNQFTKLIPIIVVMKAMGIESDQEVVQMIGRDPRYGDLLFSSLQECASEKIYTKQQALHYMDDKVKKYPDSKKINLKSEAILRDVFLAHVPVNNGNFRAKCIYTGVMLRRMMDAINADIFDDKDYLGNKRLQLSGQLVSLLFEDLFKRLNYAVAKSMVNPKQEGVSSADNSHTLWRNKQRDNLNEVIENNATITFGLERAINTGNWDLGRYGMSRKGVSQPLSRLSYLASLGYLTRISTEFEKTRKISGLRALKPSQWGMICPCDTRVGELCGLTKSLALVAHVTTDQEDGPLMNLCYSLGVEDLSILSGEEIHAPGSFLVMFNGLILGKHKQPQIFATNMRTLRRSGKIGEFVSIFVNEKQLTIHIASDGGRVCRPLVIADKGISRVQDIHMKELRDGVRTFDDFLYDGLIEYLDVNEENNALIALREHEDQDDVQRNSITHIEIDPLTILGVVAGLIPYPHYNQSPCNTYQCAMGKQAIGNIAYNQVRSSLLTIYMLHLFLFVCIHMNVGYDKLGAGQNATVAVMSYSGYDAKDAIVLNKSSLDRGFGRCIVMKKYTVKMQKYQDGISEKNVKPERDKDGKMFELIGGKASVVAGGVDGRFHYGTAFGEPSGNADEVENMRLAMELLELQFF
ncbi:hypothetical protein ACQ4PT_028931 [Festuca glaucescens]